MKDTFMTMRSGKELTMSSETGGDRKQAKKRSIRTQVQSEGTDKNSSEVTEPDQSDKLSQDTKETEQVTDSLMVNFQSAKPLIHIAMSKELWTEFINGYMSNKQFKTIYAEASEATDARLQGAKFLKTDDGLLYFLNADFQPQAMRPKEIKANYIRRSPQSPHGDSSFTNGTVVAQNLVKILLEKNEDRYRGIFQDLWYLSKNQEFKLQEIWLSNS